MSNPTTVRLTPEQEEMVKKMARIHGSQANVIREAVRRLWECDGETAEQLDVIIQASRED